MSKASWERPPLIPPPRSVRVTGGGLPLRAGALAISCEGCAFVDVIAVENRLDWVEAKPRAATDVLVRVTAEGVDPQSIRGQSYRLEIVRPDEGSRCFAKIEAPGASGARYGLQTLGQLVRCARMNNEKPTFGQGRALGAREGWALREMVIEDAPSFATRGVMLDVSRDRVPTLEALGEIIEQLAALKINHLQLYMEHAFAYAGHEDVWRDASPLTAEEIGVIETAASGHGIELAANQNCFGHLTRWLNLPRYAHLAETHGEWVFDNGQVRVPRSGSFSLCPIDPRSLEFVDDLLGQLLPCFASRRVNIGCDETFDVGTGRSREAVERRGRAAVYAEYVNAVAAIARKHGHAPMFWADIALREPGAMELLDDDLVALVWGYEADAPFDRWCRMIREAASGRGREIWMCPGTSSWRSFTGRTSERRGNLIAAARAGIAHGATGFLVTDWGDHGHRQQWPIALHGLADGASVAWNAQAAEQFEARAASIHLMGDARGQLGPWLEQLGDLDLSLRDGSAGERVQNASAMSVDLHEPWHVEPHFGGGAQDWLKVRERLDELAGSMPTIADAPIRDELLHTLEVCRVAIDRALMRRGASGIHAAGLAGALRGIIAEHRRLWLQRSRPGGLEDSCRYYEVVAEDVPHTA